MKKIAWVTDSTAFLDEELQHHPDIFVIPLQILLDDEQFEEGINLTPEQLFEKLKIVKSIPKTSQPSVGAFRNLYNKLAERYDAIISIHVSSKLSGTFSASEQASQLVHTPVISVDSKLISFPMSVLIKQGIKWHEEGKSISEITSKIAKLVETNETYVLVGSLEQLHRSGRMSGLQFFLGSLLNVKPIISLDKGILKMKEKVRSENRAKERIIQFLKDSFERYRFNEVYLMYGLHEKEALSWKKELEKKIPQLKYFCYPLCTAIGLHTGENTLGISWYNGLTK